MAEISIRDFVDDSVEPAVSGFLHAPETASGRGLVLTHGAGGNAQSPLLVALAQIFCSAGYTVLRCTLPYRQRRSFGPPGPADAARDRAGIKNALAAVTKLLDLKTAGAAESAHLFLGGHSYGGRQCSMLCAEEPELASALLLLSYPLHPPGRSQQQRTQHLPDLRTPTLFVSGTRDPFGSIAELEHAIKMIPAKTMLFPVENAGHDLGFKGKTKKEQLPRQIYTEFAKLVGD